MRSHTFKTGFQHQIVDDLPLIANLDQKWV